MSAYRCPVCDYVYEEAKGAPREGFPAGIDDRVLPDVDARWEQSSD